MANDSQFEFRLKITTLELDVTSGTPSSTNVNYITRTIDVFEIDHTNIKYRAEGNANIVLAIPQRCQVLRLPKNCSKSKRNICHSTAKEYLRTEQIFYVYNYISSLSPIFGGNLSSRPTLVRIEFHNVNVFNEWLYNRRPSHRINRSEMDLKFEYGLLYQDACAMDVNFEDKRLLRTVDSSVFAIEIKPKQGWNICYLPDSLRNLLGIDDNVRNKCRFCAMQYLKMKKQAAHDISKYCPLDLFSGTGPRMDRALRHLVATPQNNFRFFINGNIIYSDGDLIDDLHATLTRHFGNGTRSSMDHFLSLIVKILQYDSVLDHVLKLQWLAQETISFMADKYRISQTSFTEPLKDGLWPHSHVNELSKKLNQIDRDQIGDNMYEVLKTTYNLDNEEIYEIGATALDVSIMLTFQETKSTNSINLPIIREDDRNFLIKSAVFDLDPKLYPKHFTKYVEKTRESYDAYRIYAAKPFL